MKLSSRWWPIGVALVGCAYSLKQFDWRNVGRVLATLPYVPLLAEISLATLAVFAVCSLRWIAVSGLPWRLSVIRDVHPYVSVVIGASIATPLQLGEILKLKFARDSGLPLSGSVVNLTIERIIDLSAIAGMAMGGVAYSEFCSFILAAVATATPFAVGLSAPSILRSAAASLAHTRVGAPLKMFMNDSLSATSLVIVALCTVAKWGLTMLAWIVIAQAVGVQLTFAQGMLLVGSVTTLSILSMIPAGLGVQEVSVRAILISMKFDPAQAEAVAIVLRIFTPLMVVLGLIHIPFLVRRRQSPHKDIIA